MKYVSTQMSSTVLETRDLITPEEVEPGIVAWIDLGAAAQHPGCRAFSFGGGKPHPCVCVSTTKAIGIWAVLTTTHRPERLFIHPEWRSGGAQSFLNKALYLCDGSCLYAIPRALTASFNGGEITSAADRGRVSQDGLAAILSEIKDQRHRRTQ